MGTIETMDCHYLLRPVLSSLDMGIGIGFYSLLSSSYRGENLPSHALHSVGIQPLLPTPLMSNNPMLGKFLLTLYSITTS
jgi:hypothetical protein